MANPGMGAQEGHGICRSGNPADTVLVTTSALLEYGGAEFLEAVPEDVVITPKEWRETGVDGSRSSVSIQVPSVPMLSNDAGGRFCESDALVREALSYTLYFLILPGQFLFILGYWAI